MRVPRTVLALAVLTSGAGTVSCKHLEDPPPPPFEVDIVVNQDKEVPSPVPDAVIQRNNREVARSDAAGKAILKITGSEGDAFDLWVKCPEGFSSPEEPVTVRLQRLGDGKAPQYPVECTPATRKVVVVLAAFDQAAPNAQGLANIPVMWLNKQVATLDASGAASFVLTAKPGEHIELKLDTSDKKYELYKPPNPVLQLDVQNKDHIYPLEQPFTKDKVKVVVVPRHGPVQLGGPRPL